MNPLLQLKRFLLLIPETILFGISYAQFFFWSRSPVPLDASEIWQRLTQPGHPWLEGLQRHYPPAPVRRLYAKLYVRFKDRIAGIAQHYDLSNQFYQLFLDRRYMFYTCADFIDRTDTLEEAQNHKANFLVNLLDPQPGERILELGCGWGAMLKKLYETTGDRENLYGYTLSIEQKHFIDDHYGFHAEFKDFITTDYAPNAWDKIYSIGGMEHVPQADLLPLAQKLAKTIKPTGRLVHHFFSQTSATPATRLLAGGADVFPGLELSHWQQHLDVFEAAGLRVVHHSVHDYRPTLQAWFQRLTDQAEEAIKLVGVYHYNRYLCYLAVAWRLFNDRDLTIMRFVLQRQDAPVAWRSTLYAAPDTAPVEDSKIHLLMPL
ncbi:MAG: class I SAM-dependent methyltransferase [Synechococcales bacterium]|nr:class I SAM-dependent methyltransferase [Synechococcales bacterium]